jgi:hypothetical protein
MTLSNDMWVRIAQLLVAFWAIGFCVLLLSGCGIVKPDPDYMYGPKSTFEKHERYSGGD